MTWESIKTDVMTAYNDSCYHDKRFVHLIATANAGKIDLAGSQELAKLMAKNASAALRKFVTPEVAADGQLFSELVLRVVSPMLKKCQGIAGEAARIACQNIINDAGVGLKAVSAVDETRISNLADKMLGYEKKTDGLFLIDQQILDNLLQGAVDSTAEENANFMDGAGIEVRIKRTVLNPSCAYCRGLSYEGALKDAPSGIWSRHRDCDCKIEYWNAQGVRSDVNNYRRK